MSKGRVKIIIGAAAAAAVLAAAGMSLVITQQDEYKLIRQFGKVSRVIENAGVSLKIPFVERADTLPKQTLLYDLPPSDVITRDNRYTYSDPLKFAQTLNSSIANAETRINTSVYNATKNAISSTDQDEVISGRDEEMTAAVMEAIQPGLSQYGIEIELFEIKRLDLPDDNKEAVYERMISERNNIAATYTAEGNAEAQVIRNTTDKEVSIQLSEAQQQAEILEAEGEAEYMRILADAYSDEEKTDFYSFVRSLDALKASMAGGDKTVILSEDSPIAQLFMGE